MEQIDVTALRAALGTPAGSDTGEASGPPVVVDVREPHEFDSGHVPGAVNVPMSQVVDRVGEITSLTGPVFLVCQSGGRSAQVAAWLGQQGHEVTNVAGGTLAWKAAGFPVE
ncbi:rhodanese-like domain-containing protein [Actinotalea subterranea]|uniref:rhodanese-like domain-containing protein n=1 Tax=Actinotalea subterranea TaxID=2607497 RepID=UPI0011ED01C8|nr:rhodanese-like domain-containing protein [Actinotalea subterranea]